MSVTSREFLGFVVWDAGFPAVRPIDPGAPGLPPGRPRLRLDRRSFERLRRQGWDERLDPEPHCMARLVSVEGRLAAAAFEYVNPHHNID